MHRTPLILDLETAPLPDAPSWLDEPQAPANYKDPVKIAEYIREATASQLDKCALDIHTAQIIAVGVAYSDLFDGTVGLFSRGDISDERDLLSLVCGCIKDRPVIGFNVRFDLAMLMSRSRALGVPFPRIDLSPYSKKGEWIDLADELCFGIERQLPQVMSRKLSSYARRYGLPHDDTVTGADIPELYAAGDWDAIEAHVRSDVELTAQLARWLGVLPQIESAVR